MQPSTKKALGVSAAVLGGLFVLYLILKTPKAGKTAEASPIKGTIVGNGQEPVPGTGSGNDVFGNVGDPGVGSNIDPNPPISTAQAQSTNLQAAVTSGTLVLPQDPPTPPTGISGTNPSATPKAGDYYRVKKDDTLIGIMRAAGNPDRTWPKLVNHPLNGWIPKIDNPTYFGNRKGLPLYERFDPPGWKTKYWDYYKKTSVFPVVYVPTYSEATL